MNNFKIKQKILRCKIKRSTSTRKIFRIYSILTLKFKFSIFQKQMLRKSKISNVSKTGIYVINIYASNNHTQIKTISSFVTVKWPKKVKLMMSGFKTQFLDNYSRHTCK